MKLSHLCRVGNSLIRSSLICSIAQIKWAPVSDSLILLKTNEQLWANRSGRSCQKSHCEQFAQVDHDKWVKARIARFLRELLICSFTHKKRAIRFKKLDWNRIFFYFLFFKLLIHSFLMSHMSKSSGCSPKMSELLVFWANWWFFEKIAHSLIICSFFCKKTSASLRKPMS